MGKIKRGEIIATCTYPPYCIKWIGEKHFVIGGGGGASKTGVPNKFVSLIPVYLLKQTESPATCPGLHADALVMWYPLWR